MEQSLILIAVLILLALAGMAILAVGGGGVWWRRSMHAQPPADPPRAGASKLPVGSRNSERLQAYHQAGQDDELLRFLERTMPEWPVASSLIEVARELVALERQVGMARDTGVPEPVTTRLAQEAERIAGPLWDLADRVAAAAFEVASPALREELAHEDEKLVRLLVAMRDARAGLAELSLAGTGGRNELRRAEGRFRALAETAREIRDLDQ